MRSCRPLPGPPPPIVTSTISIDGAFSWMASASAGVMFGRFSSCWKSAPPETLSIENLATTIVFGPMPRKRSRNDSSKPRISEVIPTIDVIPMTIPRTVSAERSLLPRTVSQDMTMISLNRVQRIGLLPPQRFDRVEPGGAHRRIEAEEQADERGHADAEDDRPRLDDRRQRGQLADHPRDEEPERRAAQAAERRERDRLGEDLPEDVAPPRAQRLAQPDFAGPLADHHQHDVHDDDAADHEREADDTDENGENSGGGLAVDVEERIGREDAEIVGLLGPQATFDAKRRPRVIHGGRGAAHADRLHRELERLPRAK